MRAKSMVLIMIALGCGLVASIGISQVMRKKNEVEEIPMTTVVVAAGDINIMDELTEENTRLEEWEQAKVPEGAITSLEEAGELRPITRLFPGELILSPKLGDGNTGAPIPDGHRVVAAKVDLESSVASLIQPGDRVDLIAFFRKGPEIPKTMTKTILTNVRVYAVDQDTIRVVDAEGKGRVAKSLSFLVPIEEVGKLSLAIKIGDLRASKRGSDDTTEDVGDEATIEQLLNGPASNTDPDRAEPAVAASTPTPAADPSFFAFMQQNSGAQPPPAMPSGPQFPVVQRTMEIITPSGIETINFTASGRVEATTPAGGPAPRVTPPVSELPAPQPGSHPATDGGDAQAADGHQLEEALGEKLEDLDINLDDLPGQVQGLSDELKGAF